VRSAGRRGASLRAQRMSPLPLERAVPAAATTTTTCLEQQETRAELVAVEGQAAAGGTIGEDAQVLTERFNAQLHELAERSDDRGALAAFNRMRPAGARPNLATFNHLFRACKKVCTPPPS
jgi:hypothetical protein